MKKGCFLTGITLFTIIVGAGFYLYRKYWPEIKEASKEKILNVAINDINEKINSLDKSVYQDSLKLLLRKNIALYKEKKFDEAMNKFGEFVDQTRFFINDGKIDSVEFTALKNMVK
ncbi:MAG: hypothetical protein GYA14_06485 [Ignavibacteria bacterium]|nr:hypothetical protein [Ignavibacteria bacterium]